MSQARAASRFAFWLALWWLLTTVVALLSWHLAVPGDLCLAGEEAVAAKRQGQSELPRHVDDALAACGYCLLALTHPGVAPQTLPFLPPTVAVLPLVGGALLTALLTLWPTPPVRAPPVVS